MKNLFWRYVWKLNFFFFLHGKILFFTDLAEFLFFFFNSTYMQVSNFRQIFEGKSYIRLMFELTHIRKCTAVHFSIKTFNFQRGKKRWRFWGWNLISIFHLNPQLSNTFLKSVFNHKNLLLIKDICKKASEKKPLEEQMSFLFSQKDMKFLQKKSQNSLVDFCTTNLITC